jgi:TonB family protein
MIAAVAFPALRSTAELPSVRALSVRGIGDVARSARVAVCVGPAGETTAVSLEKSSGDRAFDEAVLDDVTRWHYEPFTGPHAARACERATITYMP